MTEKFIREYIAAEVQRRRENLEVLCLMAFLWQDPNYVDRLVIIQVYDLDHDIPETVASLVHPPKNQLTIGDRLIALALKP